MYNLIVWFNPNKNIYYYKLVRGTYSQYRVGFKNQYGHEVVLIIDDVLYHKPSKKPIKQRVITSLISFLQNKLN